MTDLIAAKQAVAEGNERAVLRCLVDAGDEGLAPTDVWARSDLAETTGRAAARRLVDQGLVVRDGRKRLFATIAGRAEAGAALPGVRFTTALGDAIDLLPAEALRAFVRLLFAGIVARHHLRHDDPGGWGSFIAVGPTKTGKTSMAAMACAAFGVDPAVAIRLAAVETSASLWGRRVRTDDGWRFEPAQELCLPFLCIDEFDKAPAELRKSLLTLAQGNARMAAEGAAVDVAPTLLLCANGGPQLVHEAYRRRSVVLDLAPLAPLLGGIHQAVTAILGERRALPVLDLDRLIPPVRALPADVAGETLEQLRAGLTDEGWQHCDERAVLHLAVGRAALNDGDLRQATMATVADYLTCAGTVGETRPGTPSAVLQALGGDHLVPDPGRGAVELAARDRQHRATDNQAVELLATRAAAVEGIRRAEINIRHVPEERRPEAAGVRAALQEMIGKVGAQRSEEGLRAAIEDATRWVNQARRIRAEVDEQRRAAKVRQAKDAADRKAAATEQRNRKQAAKQAAATDSKRHQETARRQAHRCRQLEQLLARTKPKPGEDPVEVLVAANVLARQPRTAQRSQGRPVTDLWARARGLEAPGPRVVERTWVALVDAAGNAYRTEEVTVGAPSWRNAVETAARQEGLVLRPPPAS